MSTIQSHAATFVKMLEAKITGGAKITEVYFVACGGSLVDLYPSKYFLASESRLLRTDLYTANEFAHAVPKRLGAGSVVILCTHSGGTPEVVRALRTAKNAGAFTVTLTHNASSEVGPISDQNIVYEWGDESRVRNNPMAISLALCLELLQLMEGYPDYEDFREALLKIDEVVAAARSKIVRRVVEFAEAYQHEEMFYILSSGATYGHAYGFAICSLMEMQWLNASAVHSGEFFHGPFEITDKDTNFIVLLNEGRTRALDKRVITFLKRYAKKYEVVDARELGIAVLPAAVVEFFNPVLFYSVMCDYREALSKLRNHPLEKRRYMGIVEY